MPHDAYVKFGESDGKGPDGTPLPAIEGDSSDQWHYWWCELRDCGFDLEATDWKSEKDEESENEESATAKFRKVNLSKRVDWASTQLFMQCCYQAMALAKSKKEQEDGWIDQVTIEICRQTGAMVKLGTQMVVEKIPFITVKYYGVRITHYSVKMSGPEPAESLTFEFQSLEFEHQRTDPYTGLKVENGTTRTGKLANGATGQAGTGSMGGSGSSSASAGVSVGTSTAAATVTAGSAAGNGNGSAAVTPAPLEAGVNANFPGFWQGNGFGILPD